MSDPTPTPAAAPVAGAAAPEAAAAAAAAAVSVQGSQADMAKYGTHECTCDGCNSRPITGFRSDKEKGVRVELERYRRLWLNVLWLRCTILLSAQVQVFEGQLSNKHKTAVMFEAELIQLPPWFSPML
jgi:hypothetical protein